MAQVLARKSLSVFAGLAAALAVAHAARSEAASAVPDLSGFWSRTTFGMEPPASGQGPVQPVNRRRPDGTRADNSQFMKTAPF